MTAPNDEELEPIERIFIRCKEAQAEVRKLRTEKEAAVEDAKAEGKQDGIKKCLEILYRETNDSDGTPNPFTLETEIRKILTADKAKGE